jgi:uncharacterized protein (TIGR00251 family)
MMSSPIGPDFVKRASVTRLWADQSEPVPSMRLISKPDGIALAIKVVPGSSRQRVVGEYGDGLKITVTAAAERGAANEAVIAVLADSLQIAAANVRIVRGHQSPRKEVLIVGLSAEEIERRLSSINE